MKATHYIYNICAGALMASCLMTTVGCSDDFLEEKRPYNNFGPSEVYNDINAVKLRLNYIYQMSLPYAKGISAENNNNNACDLWPVGMPDMLSRHTDEFPGYSDYNNPNTTVTYNSGLASFFYGGTNGSPWKKMRECTDVIVRCDESETLDEIVKRQTIGQARFFRATRYWRLFKRFGGLPVITEIQSTVLRDTAQLRAKRNSTDSTFRFIIGDLKQAAEELPARWDEEVNDWGRVTSGTALALAGVIANYYASPIFNRADDRSRWQEAYDINKAAIAKLDEGHFGLSYEGQPGVNATNWARIWSGNVMGGETLNSEAVFVTMCNNIVDGNSRNLFNGWEQMIRPTSAMGGCSGQSSTGMRPTAEMIDLFPMADGKRPTEAGEYIYDKKLFFLNRDPRFYRTFAFPGVEWKFSGTIEDKADATPYVNGSNFELQNYAWYDSFDNSLIENRFGFYGDMMGSSGQTVYVRKRSQDFALGGITLYNFTTENGFQRNGSPMITMRYTEVLLNLAEAACGIGNLQEALDILKRIRQRVGYTGDCGLNTATLLGDRAKMFEAILYERQIELAYEGKRFDDCHRWMLFDGGVHQGEIGGPSWIPSGWQGNTCQYLGVTPLNDIPLHQIELYFDPAVYTGALDNEHDPFNIPTLGLTKPAAIDVNTADFTTVADATTGAISYNDAKVQALANFYNQNLIRKDVLTCNELNEDFSATLKPEWKNNCYLMGLTRGDQDNNPNIIQTMGWESFKGGMGAYDPLSLTPELNPDVVLPMPVVETTEGE